MKRCLIITHMNYPENRGVTQLIGKLYSKGYYPYIVSYPGISKDSQIKDRCKLLPYFKNMKSIFRYCFSWSFWWNPLLFIYFFIRFLQIKPSFIYVREPAFLFYPLILSKFLHIPLSIDIRENPNVYFVKWTGLRNLQRIVSGPVFIRKLVFPLLMKNVDHISCVSDVLLRLIKKEYSLDDKKLSVLANYPSFQFMESACRITRNCSNRNKKQLRLIHTGSVTFDRGLQDILKGIAEAKKRGVDCQLTILGNGPYTPFLKEQAKNAELYTNIDFLSPVEPVAIPGILSDHDIGICSNHINENSKVTIPGKLFEYMASGLPVLSNSRLTVANIVNEANCGFIYESCDPNVLADELQEIYRTLDSEQLKRYGENGRHFLKEKIKKEHFRLPNAAGHPSSQY